jgi:hypothetical protein
MRKRSRQLPYLNKKTEAGMSTARPEPWLENSVLQDVALFRTTKTRQWRGKHSSTSASFQFTEQAGTCGKATWVRQENGSNCGRDIIDYVTESFEVFLGLSKRM